MSPQAVNLGRIHPDLLQRRDYKYSISSERTGRSMLEIEESERNQRSTGSHRSRDGLPPAGGSCARGDLGEIGWTRRSSEGGSCRVGPDDGLEDIRERDISMARDSVAKSEKLDIVNLPPQSESLQASRGY
ncbi:hypothetical protein MLD38_016515 [Melastoma candidum]|uniref:Uncharacterized protein n=2 Tax=Melastoma candidum TaxID=119954 RepID=A0ACB9QPG0_9MYRT|nr:hypothetical protein MLD38_016510 [Melastoma candidum]KAI4367890.1 hypothetical protein MLD38_016515 [Melastoma candidum]